MIFTKVFSLFVPPLKTALSCLVNCVCCVLICKRVCWSFWVPVQRLHARVDLAFCKAPVPNRLWVAFSSVCRKLRLISAGLKSKPLRFKSSKSSQLTSPCHGGLVLSLSHLWVSLVTPKLMQWPVSFPTASWTCPISTRYCNHNLLVHFAPLGHSGNAHLDNFTWSLQRSAIMSAG